MTRDETKKAIDVMQAWLNNEPVEVLVGDSWTLIKYEEFPLGFYNQIFRIKPKKEKKYWDCPQDVVIGAVYRIGDSNAVLYPKYFSDATFHIGLESYQWDKINLFKYSTDGITWQECLK